MYVDKSDPRKTAKFAISIGSATLFKEVFSSSFLIFSSLVFFLIMSVFVKPGFMELTLTPLPPSSLAKTLAVDEIAALELEYANRP